MFGLLYNLFTRSLLVLVLAMLSVNYLPDRLFQDFAFEPKSMEPNDYESVLPLAWNSKLSDGQPEYIQLNNILGPESVAIAGNGLIYTGLADGRLVELDPSSNYKLRQVLRVKQSDRCLDNVATRAAECGRFLQLRFRNSTLFALESSDGLYRIDNLKTGTKSLVGPKPLAKTNLYNGFAFDPKNPDLVYITISSTRWDLQMIVWGMLELESSGKLVALDIKTGKRAVVLDNLMMPNGVDVDVNRDELIFSETSRSRVSSVDLEQVRAAFKNAKDGEKLAALDKTILIPTVPGIPDNIIVDGDIAYIALPFVKPNGKEFADHVSTMPNVRKAYARFIFAVGRALEYLCENVYHHPLLETVYRELKSGHFNYRVWQSEKSALLEYNLATRTSSLRGSDNFGFLSEAVPDNKGNLYLGSFRSPFLVKVKL